MHAYVSVYVSIVNPICQETLIPYHPERNAKGTESIYIPLGYSCLWCWGSYYTSFLKMWLFHSICQWYTLTKYVCHIKFQLIPQATSFWKAEKAPRVHRSGPVLLSGFLDPHRQILYQTRMLKTLIDFLFPPDTICSLKSTLLLLVSESPRQSSNFPGLEKKLP